MHAVDARVVGSEKVAGELEVIGGVGKDEIDAGVGETFQRLETISNLDARLRLGGTDTATLTHGTQLLLLVQNAATGPGRTPLADAIAPRGR
jgi:hypothetical protein